MADLTVVNDAVLKRPAILTMPENASIRLYVKRAGLVRFSHVFYMKSRASMKLSKVYIKSYDLVFQDDLELPSSFMHELRFNLGWDEHAPLKCAGFQTGPHSIVFTLV